MACKLHKEIISLTKGVCGVVGGDLKNSKINLKNKNDFKYIVSAAIKRIKGSCELIC